MTNFTSTFFKPPIWGTLLLLISGVVYGASFLRPDFWPLAWLGVAGTALALSQYTSRKGLILGLVLGGLAHHWVGFPWTFDAVYRWGGSKWGPGTTTGIWVLINIFGMILPERLPIIIMVSLKSLRQKIPMWIWLPLAWWCGELLTFYTSGIVVGDFLYSQWQFPLVLKSLGYLGWETTLLISVASCVLGVEALRKFSVWRLAVVLALGAGLFLLPPLASNYRALQGIGAVHMTEFVDSPRSIPANIDLLVWPEDILTGRWRANEGPGNGEKMKVPVTAVGTYHILGRLTLNQDRLTQNSLLALAPDGEVLATRAKRFLFPAGERDYFGIRLSSRQPMAPGKRVPILEVNGRKIAALLCYEEFDRRLAFEGKAEGAELITVSAMEHSVGSSQEAASQFLGVAVLMAVETGLPLVRSSYKGVAAFISPDGTVLAVTQPRTKGILTLHTL